MFGRLAMGFAPVRAGTRVLMLVLVQAVSIPVSGFDGWMQASPRRLEIIQQQFESRAATRDASSRGRGGSLTQAPTRDQPST